MAKPAFNKKKILEISKLDLNLRNRLVKCYIWSVDLFGVETYTLRNIDLKCFEICWRRVEKISWTDRLRNEELVRRVKEKKNILHTINRRKVPKTRC